MSLTTSNGKLLLDGLPCNHVGVNAAYILARRWYVDTDTQYIETLDNLAGMGVKVIRCIAIPNAATGSGSLATWGTATGLSAGFYTAQDVIFDYAATKGIQIIPVLFGNYWAIANYKSEKLNQLGVSASATRAYMRTCATEYVAHYASHAAIAGWEIGNEWNNYAELAAYPTGNDYTGAAYSLDANNLITIPNLIDAYSDIATTIRQNDSTRAIMSGNAGPWYTNKYGGYGYQLNLQRLNPDPIDTITLHLYSYPTNNIWMRQGLEPIKDIIGIAKQAGKTVGKPVVLGETGIIGGLATEEKDFVTLTDFLTSPAKPELTLLWNYYKPGSTLPDTTNYDFYSTGSRARYADLVVKANKNQIALEVANSGDVPTGYVSFTGTQCFTTPMPTFNSCFTVSYWTRYRGARNDNFPRILSATSDESTNGFILLDLATSATATDYSEHYFRYFNSGGTSATLRSGHTFQNTWKHKTFVFKNWSFTFTADDTTDILTLSSASSDVQTGDLVRLTTTGTLPGGLATATDYYVIRVSDTTIKLATGQGNAYLGTTINLSSAGSGTHTITCLSVAVYDNGLKTSSENSTSFSAAFVAASSGNMVIGANRNANADFFKGDLAKVRIWQRGFSELEAWENYIGNPPVGYTGYLETGITGLTAVGSPTWTSLPSRTVSTRTVGTRTVTSKQVFTRRGI